MTRLLATTDYVTLDETIWAMQRTTMSCMTSEGLFFMMCSNGRRKSFWKLKPGNSPFSRNFIDNWRRLSTAKKATPSSSLHPTALKCSPEQVVPSIKSVKSSESKFRSYPILPISSTIVFVLAPCCSKRSPLSSEERISSDEMDCKVHSMTLCSTSEQNQLNNVIMII